MNFTREPIIETVITPREGCKLIVRSSKGNGQEDYFVDAVEVVSFGHSFFFRSTERPKSFLVPVSDYEILELKETRMILKNVSTERSIKIGGGREAPPRREVHHAPSDSTEEPSEGGGAPSEHRSPQPQGSNNKRDRRRRGRRGRDRNDRPPMDDQQQQRAPLTEGSSEPASMDQQPTAPAEPVKAPSFISKLFPPPSTLIKETLSRYKPVEAPTPPPAVTHNEPVSEPSSEETDDEE